jgi:phosphopantetheine adenylyltransferase
MHTIDMVRQVSHAILTIILSNIRKKRVNETDLRIKLMNEIVKSIRLVKMYVWERPFQLKVRRVRR